MKKLFVAIFMALLLFSCKRPAMILGLTWMDKDFTDTIKYYSHGDTVGLLVKTKNFKVGSNVDVTLKDDELIDDNGDTASVIISGTVERDKFVRIIVNTATVMSEYKKEE